MASAATEFRSRLQFMEIDNSTQDHLKAFWRSVGHEMPQLLDELYDHLGTEERTRKLLENRCVVNGLKDAQLAHWERLFTSNFDVTYFEGVRRVGLAHHRIGLEPRWYIAAYSFLLTRLLALAVRRNRFKPLRLAAVQDAITKAVMLDMEISISVYEEAAFEEKVRRGETMAEMVEQFDRSTKDVLGGLANSSGSLMSMADGMHSLAEDTSGKVEDLKEESAAASRGMQVVSSATEELSHSIMEIGEHAGRTTSMTEQATEEARDTKERITELIETADDIGAVVDLIRQITGKTNMLAINASIEASRAGDSGKGFAVVANEVKDLARQTAEATEEIVGKIEKVQSVSSYVAEAVTNMDEVIQSITEGARSTAAAVEQQRAATQEITQNMLQAAESGRSVDGHFRDSLARSEKVAEDANRLLEASKELDRMSQMISQEIASFLGDIRKV